jgi:hypothetical protein
MFCSFLSPEGSHPPLGPIQGRTNRLRGGREGRGEGRGGGGGKGGEGEGEGEPEGGGGKGGEGEGEPEGGGRGGWTGKGGFLFILFQAPKLHIST